MAKRVLNMEFLNTLAQKTFVFLLGPLIICACNSTAVSEDKQADVEVMLLGTFHFTGGGNDLVNPKVDDFLAPSRQAEIEIVLDKLEAYAPDKIMLELELRFEDEFNQEYNRYLDGIHALGVNERQQLGMRLAARLGHERLYAIDFDNFLDYRGALAAAKKLGQNHLLQAMEAETEATKALLEKQRHLSLQDRLIALNTVSNFDHNFFMRIAQMGSVEDPQGALQTLTWWERNLVMFARTAQYAEPGDKILIIVGSGHNYILHEFFSSADGFTLRSPVKYLK